MSNILLHIANVLLVLTSTFADTPEGYIAVSVYDNGQTYYGWIEVSRPSAPLDGSLMSTGASVTFTGSASSPTPGSSILAGSGGAVVPVSIIASTLGFFAIGTGLYFRRKRKKA